MKTRLNIIFEQIFQIFLLTYLILLLAETVKTGFVSFFFNLNILLVVVLISGILSIIPLPHLKNKNHKNSAKHFLMLAFEQWHKEKKEEWNWHFAFVISVAGGLLVNFKTKELGNISLLVSLLACIIIFLLSYLVYHEEDQSS